MPVLLWIEVDDKEINIVVSDCEIRIYVVLDMQSCLSGGIAGTGMVFALI